LAEYRARKANNELLSENELADFEELEDDEKSLILDED
jgi:hypothetical protein